MTVIDPVCGMSIEEKDAAATTVYGGRTYSFCSISCKTEFDQNPQAFLGTQAASASEPPAPAEGRLYTCPMHPEIRQGKPGSCPKCGMALEPVTPLVPSKAEWTCPMHPEIVRDGPGTCPICGMALEPRTAVFEEENPELIDMTRRFRISLVLTVPLFALDHVPSLFPCPD